MPRYIDADDFDKHLSNPPYTIYNGEMFEEWFEECFKTQPTADVEPVRHGQWIDGNCGDYVCSVCGWEFSSELPYMARKYDAETEEIMRYCMHCGAKMDGGEGKE